MMRQKIVALAAALLLAGGMAQASVIVTLINDPVADGVRTEDGVTGYQYIWDVETTGDAPAALSFLGFDGSQAAWVRTHSYLLTTGVWQKWGNPAAGVNSCFPSLTGDDTGSPSTSDGSGGWRDSIDLYGDFGPADDPYPWAMTNTWHDPADYAPGAAAFMPTTAGLTLDEGLSWDGTVSHDQTHSAGLMLTIRVVHPCGPGVMCWEASGGLGSGTTTGPTGVIPEPATLGLLSMGGLAALRRRK